MAAPSTGTNLVVASIAAFFGLVSGVGGVYVFGTTGSNGARFADTANDHIITVKASSDEAANRTLSLPSLGGDKYLAITTNADGSVAAASAGFDVLTGGTNSTAAMVVGTGASLATSGSGTITVHDNGITTAKILNANVTAAKMVNAGVFTGDATTTFPAITIGNDAITTVKILNANVTAAKMVNAGVFTGDATTTFPALTIGNNAITAVKMVNAGVFTGDVTTTFPAITIGNDAITTVKILNANVTAAKMVNAGVFTGDATTTFPALTIGNNAITLAKMATIAQDRIIGGATGAGTATPTALTVLPTGCMPALTGDVTNSAGSLATTIAVKAVTLAKMDDLATSRIIGRTTAGTGVPEALSVVPTALGGTNKTSAYAVGDVVYASGTTTLAGLADVATGQVLTSGGANTAPAWSASPTLSTPIVTGINFGGPGGAGATSTTMNDYEEGTWTPRIIGTTGTLGTATYSPQKGTYTCIGNRVYIQCYVGLTNVGSWTGSAVIDGLPFTPENTTAVTNACSLGLIWQVTYTALKVQQTAFINPNVTNIVLEETQSAANASALPFANLSTSTLLVISGSYSR